MIKFYAPKDPWGCFSNFSRHQVTIYNRTWQTSEHPFQAMKFHSHRPDIVAMVHAAPSPGAAARLGRDRSYPLRSDWNSNPRHNMLGESFPESISMEEADAMVQPDDGVNRQGVVAEPLFARVKDVIMYEVCLAKFTQHGDLKETLLSTGDEVLIEDAEYDPYWGWGASFVGENKLGRILMAVRHQIR